MDGVGGQIFEIAQWVLLGCILLLFIPFRHVTRITASRILKTDAHTVWTMGVAVADFAPGDRPGNPLLPATIAGYRKVSDSPAVHEYKLDTSGGQGRTFTTMRTRTLVSEPPRRHVSTVEDVNGAPYPLGRDSRISLTLEDVPGGVRYTQSHVLVTRSLSHDLATRHAYAKQLNRVVRYFNAGKTDAPASARRGILTRLALTVLAVGSFALAFGWAFGIGLALILLLHEFGHWLAMRLMGYPKARLTLVPFLGGVAMPGQPFKSQWDNAVCVLMGPGLSAGLCAAGLLVSHVFWPQGAQNRIELAGSWMPFGDLRALIDEALAATGLVNLAQFIPVVPLDGGQLVRLMIQRHGSNAARLVAFVFAGLACVIAIATQFYLLAPIALIGVMLMSQQGIGAQLPIAMTLRQRLVILAGSLAALGVLTAASAPILAFLAGYNSPREAMAFLTGQRQPMPGAEGSGEVEPVFDVRWPPLDGLDQSTWVYGGDGKDPRHERRQWGYTLDPKPEALIWVADTSETSGAVKDRGAVAADIRTSVRSKGLSLTLAQEDVALATRHGPFAAIPFTIQSKAAPRNCIGFAGYANGGARYVYGHFCAATGGQPKIQDVVCLLDGLALAGGTGAPPAPGCAAPASAAAQ